MAPEKESSNRSMFSNGFQERHDLEQCFWTDATVFRLLKALEYSSDCCCLTTPTLAVAFHENGRDEVLLDIDERFDYLPKFRYWDLRNPTELDSDSFQVIVFDPPFFYIPMEALYKAVLAVCNGNTSTKIMIGFLIREEKELLTWFKEFNLKKTSFRLEYATVKSNKWRNYALYSNVDLPGIKRLKPKRN